MKYPGRRSFDCVSSRVLPMHPLVTAQYLILLSLRVVRDIRLDVKIYGPVTELVVLSQDDLVEKKKKEKGSAVLAAAVRIYVTDMVKEGIFPSVEEIAKDFGVSPQYLNRIYRKHAGMTIQHDMHILRMEEALSRLKIGYSPHEVSDWLEYEHYSTFSRQFSKYHHFAHPQLSASAKTLLTDQRNEIFVSDISLYEIAIKQTIDKLSDFSAELTDIIEVAKQDDFKFLPIQHPHISQYHQVPLFADHRDPFDRLIIATAKTEGLAILSADEKFNLYKDFIALIAV